MPLLIFNSDRVLILLLCSAFMRPYWEHRVHLWGLQHMKDMDLFEWVQRKATRMIRGLEYSCEHRLKELGLLSLENRRLQENLTVAFQYLKVYIYIISRRENNFLNGLIVIGQERMALN